MVPTSSPDKALKTLLLTLTNILTNMWESDKRMQVLPWYDNSQAPPITSVAKLPKTFSLLCQYFPHLTPTAMGGTKYTSIRIHSQVPPLTLKNDIDWYLRDNNHGLYPAQVQAETVDTILWLLWSSDLTDTSALRPVLEDALATRTNTNIQVGLCW